MSDILSLKKENKSVENNKKDQKPVISEIKIDDKVVKVDFKVIDKNVVAYGAAKIY